MLSFSSYGWLTVIAFLKTKTPIVGCLEVRFILQDNFGSAEISSEKPINIVSKSTQLSCNVLA